MSDPNWPTVFPSETGAFGALHVGEVNDKDARVIDEDNREVDAPPTPVVQRIVTPELVPVKACTKLLTVTQACDPQWGSQPNMPPFVQLLPADANRRGLTLRVYSPTAVLTDYVIIADDQSKLQGIAASGAPLYHGDNIDLNDYTGPIFVTAKGSSAITNITAIGTTW